MSTPELSSETTLSCHWSLGHSSIRHKDLKRRPNMSYKISLVSFLHCLPHCLLSQCFCLSAHQALQSVLPYSSLTLEPPKWSGLGLGGRFYRRKVNADCFLRTKRCVCVGCGACMYRPQPEALCSGRRNGFRGIFSLVRFCAVCTVSPAAGSRGSVQKSPRQDCSCELSDFKQGPTHNYC